MSDPARKGAQDIGHRGGAAEARVNVNDLCSSLTRFHDPLETDGMIFGHVGSHDQNGVGIDKVAWWCCRSPSAKRSAQTGHR